MAYIIEEVGKAVQITDTALNKIKLYPKGSLYFGENTDGFFSILVREGNSIITYSSVLEDFMSAPNTPFANKEAFVEYISDLLFISGDSTEGIATEDKQEELITETQKIVKNTIKFYTEDVEEDASTNTTYVGKQSVEGQWLIQKIVDVLVNNVSTTTLEYATIVNNETITTYANAWSAKATLTYSEIIDLI